MLSQVAVVALACVSFIAACSSSTGRPSDPAPAAALLGRRIRDAGSGTLGNAIEQRVNVCRRPTATLGAHWAANPTV